MKLRTKEELIYRSAPYGIIAVIPKGTTAIPALNLPEKLDHSDDSIVHRRVDGTTREELFWAAPWKGMTAFAQSWQHNYGFLLTREQLEEDKDKP